MRFTVLLLISAAALCAADDAWTKVRDLKSGTELRIYKRGSRQPILAKAGDATEDKLIVALKNEEIAIAKDDIDEIDYRPPNKNSRMKTETHESTTNPGSEPNSARPHMAQVPGASSSSSVMFGGKAEFETLYRRSPQPPKR